MRTQAWTLGVAFGGLAFLTAAVLSQQRSVGAAHERFLAPEPVEESAPVEPALVVPSCAVPLDPQAASTACPERRVPDQCRRAAVPRLSADLLAQVQSASELELLSDKRLAEFLAQLNLEWGWPTRSLELLQRYSSEDVGLWARVAQALGQSHDMAGQTDALLGALALAPGNEDFIDALGHIRPELVVAHLSRLFDMQPGSSALRARLAEALLQSGNATEACALIEALLREDPGDEQAVRLLFELDAPRALAEVERQATASPGSPELRSLLVELLAESGDIAAAEAALERFARDGYDVGSDEWGQVVDLWLDAGETARGVAALWRALAVEHGDPDAWVNRLAELAPRELLPVLERRVASDESRNDEYWGALADALWSAGSGAGARSAWERARALDPGDEEWAQRLRALDAGRDPYE